MTKKLEVADIIALGMEECCPSLRQLSAQQWKIVTRLLSCHSLQLGGHAYRCDTCGHIVVSYNSCRDRHCPSCQSVARAGWVEERLHELLPVGHFHVVFTVPQELNVFALNNKRLFYNLLFDAASETLLRLGKDPRWHGGTIGFISVLHTWGQTLCVHPHIHCIVPGGGIRADGKKWKNFRENYLFPVKVLSLLFRRLFLEQFYRAVRKNGFVLDGRLEQYRAAGGLDNLMKALKGKQWVVYAKEPFASPAHVEKYVGSYTHRVAISNSRLVSVDTQGVSFRWKDYRSPEEPKIIHLDLGEFIRRFLLHVLPQGFVRMRYYGFLSNHDRQKNIARCMRLLNRKYRPNDMRSTVAAILSRSLGRDITRCPHCTVGRYQLWMELPKRPFAWRLKYNAHRGPP